MSNKPTEEQLELLSFALRSSPTWEREKIIRNWLLTINMTEEVEAAIRKAMDPIWPSDEMIGIISSTFDEWASKRNQNDKNKSSVSKAGND